MEIVAAGPRSPRPAPAVKMVAYETENAQKSDVREISRSSPTDAVRISLWVKYSRAVGSRQWPPAGSWESWGWAAGPQGRWAAGPQGRWAWAAPTRSSNELVGRAGPGRAGVSGLLQTPRHHPHPVPLTTAYTTTTNLSDHPTPNYPTLPHRPAPHPARPDRTPSNPTPSQHTPSHSTLSCPTPAHPTLLNILS